MLPRTQQLCSNRGYGCLSPATQGDTHVASHATICSACPTAARAAAAEGDVASEMAYQSGCKYTALVSLLVLAWLL